ncbi:MAG TPA: helix-turn-helix domain-containing protein [archaeon]|nr:helix-turn-helix domain-containing protein [archaeon]
MTTALDQKKIIGENIKASRKIKGLSQRALAEKLGIAFQNLSVWENGKGAPSAKYLMKLAEILEISLDQLTSPAGFITSPDRDKDRLFFGGFRPGASVPADQLLSELQKLITKELPQLVQRELSENHSLKLIIAYLEEILSFMRSGSPERAQLRRVAESQTYQTYTRTSTRIPLPPVDLSMEERIKWERNAAVLLKWTQTSQSFWVPNWVMEKYCREVEPTRYGENLEDVADVIKGYLDKAKNS